MSHCPYSDNPARIAVTYTLNGFSDWYLPSSDEFNIMFDTIGPRAAPPLLNIGGFSYSFNYQTSSEADQNTAWMGGYSAGYQSFYNPKNNALLVRVIRSF